MSDSQSNTTSEDVMYCLRGSRKVDEKKTEVSITILLSLAFTCDTQQSRIGHQKHRTQSRGNDVLIPLNDSVTYDQVKTRN